MKFAQLRYDLTWVVTIPGDPDAREQLTYTGCDIGLLFRDKDFQQKAITSVIERLDRRVQKPVAVRDSGENILDGEVTEIQRDPPLHWPPGEPV
jgi:hypothetical protein